MLKKIISSLSICVLIFFTSAYAERSIAKTALKGQQSTSPCKGKKFSCYRQFGKSYKVMTSSKNYSEKGVASWYGPKFNRKRTSSGERFNMYHLTAAHKTLPLPTYVQVTNLRNGKKVVVKVNDRGPFISNRLIDLSYAAAKKLGMVGQGLAPVSIKALNV